MGDIHGAHKALLQCFERSNFNHANDHLICLGDVCDGWPETKQAIEELMKIKNLTYILGNHDFWTLEWIREGVAEEIWLSQGGEATVNSYQGFVPPEHMQFLEKAHPYFLQGEKLFVHAGIDTQVPLEKQSLQTLLWDRNLVRTAMQLHAKNISGNLTGFTEVFVGHTPIPAPPARMCEIWMMDTGAGWDGPLSMMDIDTKELFMSDPVPELYPEVQGRKKH